MTSNCNSKYGKEYCRYHGSGPGNYGYIEIKETISSGSWKKGGKDFTPLKEKGPGRLADGIMRAIINNAYSINEKKVKDAIEFAAWLHMPDSRENRLGWDGRTAYIEHPLRNSLRLIRLGVHDTELINASILHDTVEDHPFQIAQTAGVNTTDEEEARRVSLDYIKKRFSPRTANIVEGMSNPIGEEMPREWQGRQKVYARHVREAIKDPDVCLVKAMDFVDNALSLHHTEGTMNATGIYRKSRKYLMVLDDLVYRISQPDVKLSSPMKKELLLQFSKGKKMLEELNSKYAPSKVIQ